MMMSLMLVQMIFLTQLVCLATLHSRFLMVIMNLEMFGLLLIISMLLFMMKLFAEYMIILLILTLAACEMAVGLAVLVLMNRKNSSDSMLSMNLLKC